MRSWNVKFIEKLREQLLCGDRINIDKVRYVLKSAKIVLYDPLY